MAAASSTRPVSAAASVPPNTAHSTAGGDAVASSNTRCDATAASSSRFSKARVVDATPSTTSRSAGWVTRLCSNRRTSSARGVAHRPVQVGDSCHAPPHQIQLIHAVGIEGGQDVFGFGGFALPQQRTGQQFTGNQVAAAIHRRTRQAFAQRDVGQRDRVLSGGGEQFGVGGRVTVERQFRQPNTLRGCANRLMLHRGEQLAFDSAGGGPAKTAPDHLAVERVGEPDVQCGTVLDDANQSPALDGLQNFATDQRRQRVQRERLGERQQLQRVRLLLGQLLDPRVQQ